MSENGSVRITRLIMGPVVITLCITLLRLWGELHHWNSVLFNSNAGGAGAIVGIAWLPFIFGPYFAWKLAAAGERPSGSGKVILFAVVGLLVVVGGSVVAFQSSPGAFSGKVLGGELLMVAAAMIQFMAWGTFAKTLLAYAFAARVPVAIVMFYAIRGGWGTHYDALPPGYAGPTDFLGKYVAIALVPQFIFWIAYTMIIGALVGGVILAISGRGKVVAQAA
jgi:hypothetical protein